MKMRLRVIAYAVMGFLIFAIDRFTKYMVSFYQLYDYPLMPHVSIRLTLNRGISWGILHSSSNGFMFAVITGIIIAITGIIAFVMVDRIRSRRAAWGEVLVVAGSLSNILDRLIHGGVIDFLYLYYRDWSWAIFNIADACIVIGVLIMFLSRIHES